MELLDQQQSDIINTLLPLAKNMEEGWNSKNYEMFMRDASAGAKNVFTKALFNKELERSYEKLGKHTVGDFVTMHKNPHNIIIIWKLIFEKRSEPGLLIYHFEEIDNNLLISGATYHA